MNWRAALCWVLMLLCVGTGEARAWAPAEGPLMTQWAKDVSPARVWPEYPRPQMVREAWTNLNGLWQYAIRPQADSQPQQWDGEILVPFPIESALSGVKKTVQPSERLWYRRTFTAPEIPNGGRLLLHFGAVDWKCTVWVNAKEVGDHVGGYDPFTFDITDAIGTDGGEIELVLAVTDPTDTGNQPRGKQVLKPHGIWYTPVTGVWQTVWLEPVPQRHVRTIKVVPDLDRSKVTVTVTANGGSARVRALDGPTTVAENSGTVGETIDLAIKDPRPWSPDHPHLYDLQIELLDGETIVDHVSSYLGMRKIEVKQDAEGINRLWLNDKVLFQYGPLDQGWWPDGLYTPATDEAQRYDIEMTSRLGFNMARKHVKYENARWYYWCDKLGLLVWQDMPSGDFDKSEEGKANYRRELQAMIDALQHFPCIVMWVPFNEGWGQHDTEEIAAWIKQYDPTRPVNEASGWHDRGSGDVSDMHNYPGPGMREPEPNRVSVLGEFGGLGLPVRGHTWQDEKNWGYVSYSSSDELTDAYVELLTLMRPMIARGLSAAVYTQTTDVEIEVNGLMTYDRQVVKMHQPRIVEAARKLHLPPPRTRVLAPTSEFAPHSWRYTTQDPGAQWIEPKFDDSEWKTAPAGFGAGDRPRTEEVIRTPWQTPDIWIRRKFEVESLAEGAQLMLTIQHDEDAETYLNGKLVRKLAGHTRHYRPMLLEKSAYELLRVGENTLAIHCRQTTGGQFIDAGLTEIVE